MERGKAAAKGIPEKETGEKRAVATKKLKIYGRLLCSGGICQQEDTRKRHRNACMVQNQLDP